MIRVLSSEQMREADARTIKEGTPSQTLMWRAGEAIYDEVIKTATNDDKIVVVTGIGNNGGDGYVVARLLFEHGYNVKVFALDGNLSDDLVREKRGYKGEYTSEIDAKIIVDCIFGTGLKRELSGRFYEAVEKINSAKAYVISADIPSGISSDSGRVLGVAVKADKTVAIGEYKWGHFLSDGLDYCGSITRVDIGICPNEGHFAHIYEGGDIAKFFGKRGRNSNKGTFGSANVIAGSPKYMGAAMLALNGALSSGCGYVKLTSYPSVKLSCVGKLPQVIYLDEPDLKSDAIAIGMGCGVDERIYGVIKSLLSSYEGTLIIDADGLNCLAKYGIDILKNKTPKVILTPHIKEFSRLSALTIEEILSDPVEHAKTFAKRYGVILLLKSSTSIITDGEQVIFNIRGNTALAQGGSGDILSGYLSGTLARGVEGIEAVAVATYALGRSAEISAEQKTEYCATAQDIIENLHLSTKDIINS